MTDDPHDGIKGVRTPHLAFEESMLDAGNQRVMDDILRLTMKALLRHVGEPLALPWDEIFAAPDGTEVMFRVNERKRLAIFTLVKVGHG